MKTRITLLFIVSILILVMSSCKLQRQSETTVEKQVVKEVVVKKTAVEKVVVEKVVVEKAAVEKAVEEKVVVEKAVEEAVTKKNDCEPELEKCHESPRKNGTTCKAIFRSWFFDKETNECYEASYSGCSQKGFKTKEECEACKCKESKDNS